MGMNRTVAFGDFPAGKFEIELLELRDTYNGKRNVGVGRVIISMCVLGYLRQ